MRPLNEVVLNLCLLLPDEITSSDLRPEVTSINPLRNQN